MYLQNIILIFTSTLWSVGSSHSLHGSGVSSNENWGYEEHNGPSHWNGTCKFGFQQSPVDIIPGDTEIYFPNKPLKFHGYKDVRPFSVINNGHSIMLRLADDEEGNVAISGGGLENFIFQQVHFHWESEHTINGERYDLESHFVHYNSKYTSFEEAMKHPDGLAVVAVWFEESDSPNLEVEKLFSDVFRVLNETSDEYDDYVVPVMEQSINSIQSTATSQLSLDHRLEILLPKNKNRWYRYQGSLTTPECDEIVTWTVMRPRLPISRQVLENLRKTPTPNGGYLTKNFRSPLKLYGRTIFRSFLYDFDDVITSIPTVEDDMSNEIVPTSTSSISVCHLKLAKFYSIPILILIKYCF